MRMSSFLLMLCLTSCDHHAAKDQRHRAGCWPETLSTMEPTAWLPLCRLKPPNTLPSQNSSKGEGYRQRKPSTKWKGNQPKDGVFVNHTSDKRIISKTGKELMLFNIQKKKKRERKPPYNSQLKNGQEIDFFFSREDIHMAKRYMQRCWTSLTIKEMQTTKSYRLTPVRKAIIKMTKR